MVVLNHQILDWLLILSDWHETIISIHVSMDSSRNTNYVKENSGRFFYESNVVWRSRKIIQGNGFELNQNGYLQDTVITWVFETFLFEEGKLPIYNLLPCPALFSLVMQLAHKSWQSQQQLVVEDMYMILLWQQGTGAILKWNVYL